VAVLSTIKFKIPADFATQYLPLNAPIMSSSALPFFADATLDLAEAHDIADTPEATRPNFDATSIQAHRTQLQIPSLLQLQQRPQHLLDTTEEETASQLSAAASPVSQHSIVRRTVSLPPDMLWEPSSSAAVETDDSLHFARISGALEQECVPPVSAIRKPRWPRDISWTIAFVVLVPVVLLYPLWHTAVPLAQRNPLSKHPLSFATLHAITWTVVAVVGLTRILYRSIAGGDGDAARLQAAHVLVMAAPCSVAVYAALTVTVLVTCPKASWWAALVPAAYTIRDVYAFRRWNRRTEYAGVGYASRIAFFQAMVGMALDIISRSLRRASFLRGLTTILLIQLVVLLLWRAALLAAISSSAKTSAYTLAMVLIVWGAGKWAAATTMRMLTLLASAGVMNWCSEQGMLLSDLAPQTSINGPSLDSRDHSNGHSDDTKQDSYEDDANGLPEAYRTVDASVYQSVLDLDDALDDDYDDLDVEVLVDSPKIDHRLRASDGYSAGNSPNRRGAAPNASSYHHYPRATVKSILWTGVTINFGSIAHCGLLGGLAQFIWSQVRRVEAAQTTLHSRNGNASGFQGMTIEGGNGMDSVGNKLILGARLFARHHSDLAMTHVAAYYKGYSRAARDVATIIDQSGAFVSYTSFPVLLFLNPQLDLYFPSLV
jgi:hypothetical protein